MILQYKTKNGTWCYERGDKIEFVKKNLPEELLKENPNSKNYTIHCLYIHRETTEEIEQNIIKKLEYPNDVEYVVGNDNIIDVAIVAVYNRDYQKTYVLETEAYLLNDYGSTIARIYTPANG